MRKRKAAFFAKRKKAAFSKECASSSPLFEQQEIELQHNNNNNENQSVEEEGNRFFACYLLVSINPRFKGHTYIGFTVNPRRRIRQHNGEIGCGAHRTKTKRPWEMVMCIYGFPTNVSALKFEWAWQNPVESLAVRKAAADFKSLSGVANKIKLAYTMLTLPSWQSMNMTVNFFSTKYMKHCAGCPNLPVHMIVEIGSMDELPCYTERIDGLLENEDDSTDEVEFEDNNASTSGTIPDAIDDSITAESPINPSRRDEIGEPFDWNRESEVREPPGRYFTTQEESEPSGSISSPKEKSSSETSSKTGVIEDTVFKSSTKKSNAESSKTDSEQTDAIDVRGAFFVPHQDEIIDLSTPSPSCRNVIDRKKRRVSSSVISEFIDLTKSPNFIQL